MSQFKVTFLEGDPKYLRNRHAAIMLANEKGASSVWDSVAHKRIWPDQGPREPPQRNKVREPKPVFDWEDL